jgi:hypothetical protein
VDGEPKKLRGTAAMDPETRKRVAQAGGKAAAAKLGREHFSAIGKKGGATVSKNREFMSEIGKKGGRAQKPTRE